MDAENLDPVFFFIFFIFIFIFTFIYFHFYGKNVYRRKESLKVGPSSLFCDFWGYVCLSPIQIIPYIILIFQRTPCFGYHHEFITVLSLQEKLLAGYISQCALSIRTNMVIFPVTTIPNAPIQVRLSMLS